MSPISYLMPSTVLNIAYIDGRFSLKEVLGAGSHDVYLLPNYDVIEPG